MTALGAALSGLLGTYLWFRSKNAVLKKAEDSLNAKADERDRKTNEKNQDFLDRRMREFVDHMQGRYQLLAAEMDEKYDELVKDTAKLKDDHLRCREEHAVSVANNQYLRDAVEDKAKRIAELTMEVGLLRGRLEAIEERNGGGL